MLLVLNQICHHADAVCITGGGGVSSKANMDIHGGRVGSTKTNVRFVKKPYPIGAPVRTLPRVKLPDFSCFEKRFFFSSYLQAHAPVVSVCTYRNNNERNH